MGVAATRRMGCAFALVAALAGCASGPVLRGGIYRDRKQGFAIAAPPAGWERVKVEDASLAFRDPEQASMALSSRCDVRTTDAGLLARQLRIGLAPYQVQTERHIVLAGRPAVLQWIALAAGTRVKTVTRIAAPCVQDFVLVAPRDFDSAERSFDAWWESFAPGPERAP